MHKEVSTIAIELAWVTWDITDMINHIYGMHGRSALPVLCLLARLVTHDNHETSHDITMHMHI